MKSVSKSIKDILVIDDDIDTQIFLKKILETAGYRCSGASDLEEGKLSVESRAPHLILLDFKLGESSGFDVINFLKSKPAFSKIPVIMISATVSKKLVLRSIAAGAIEFMGKPLKPTILLQRLKKILKQHELPVLKFETPKKVQGKSIGEIIKINELGLILQSSIKLTQKVPLRIESKFLKNLGASPCTTHTSGPAKVLNPGVYRNEVAFKGMDEKTAQKIRNIKITS